MSQTAQEWERRALVDTKGAFVGVKYIPTDDKGWREWNNILLILNGPLRTSEKVNG